MSTPTSIPTLAPTPTLAALPSNEEFKKKGSISFFIPFTEESKKYYPYYEDERVINNFKGAFLSSLKRTSSCGWWHIFGCSYNDREIKTSEEGITITYNNVDRYYEDNGWKPNYFKFSLEAYPFSINNVEENNLKFSEPR